MLDTSVVFDWNLQGFMHSRSKDGPERDVLSCNSVSRDSQFTHHCPRIDRRICQTRNSRSTFTHMGRAPRMVELRHLSTQGSNGLLYFSTWIDVPCHDSHSE